MNQGIRRLFVLILGLFVLLLAGTVRWTVIEADELNANSRNARPLLQTARVPRGTIRAADGTLLARSVKQSDGTYVRRYTQEAQQASQLIGWAYTNSGVSGMEKEHQDDLTGKVRSAATLLSALRGNTERGNDVVATLEPKVQQAGLNGLNGRRGAAVAIDVKSGGVLAMVSTPNFDPNQMRNNDSASRIQNDSAGGSPAFNRATQAGYPPGSTFKVVTTAAALESGDYTPTTLVDGSSPLKVETVDLNNFGRKSYGKITLTQALTNSVNTAFARVAEDLGAAPMADAMDAFGFGKIPLIDYPDQQLYASGVYDRDDASQLLEVNDDLDIARVAIGQERLRVTPLQMGLVAAAVARDGQLPRLSTVQRVVDPDGRTLSELDADGDDAGRVMSERDAADLTAMMEKVVEEGSGTAAALSGLRVAGKTGTAERNIRENVTQPWFIGFAPADDPQVAVAVTIERTIGGTGGVDAAPIARAMMEEALR
ncbi:MAG: penicillin-binding protein 2 [Solirubrobacteraceae bacterium]|nr:penicillin-binding protein 2 [Solirubrobacteraceae bacterium]